MAWSEGKGWFKSGKSEREDSNFKPTSPTDNDLLARPTAASPSWRRLTTSTYASSTRSKNRQADWVRLSAWSRCSLSCTTSKRRSSSLRYVLSAFSRRVLWAYLSQSWVQLLGRTRSGRSSSVVPRSSVRSSDELRGSKTSPATQSTSSISRSSGSVVSLGSVRSSSPLGWGVPRLGR
jgi:hypothetical protein